MVVAEAVVSKESQATPKSRYRDVERCDYLERRESYLELVSYDVIYRFHGKITRHAPITTLAINCQ